MSDGNRVNLAYKTETTWGTTPTTGNWNDIRITSESLQQATDTIFSQEIRADRQVADFIRNGLRANGDINIELSYGAFDTFFKGGLQSADWSAVQTNTGTYSTSGATITTGSGTDCGSGVNNNQWIRLKDGATDHGYFKVVSGGGTGTLTLDRNPPAVTGGGDEEVEMGAQIVNGTTFESYSIERDYQDLATDEFARYTGMSINEWELETTPDQIITGRFGFLGKDESTLDTSGDAHTAAAANDVLTGIDGVNVILENAISVNATQFSFSISNNLRERLQIGTLGPISIGSGRFEVTGTFRAYNEASATIVDKYLNFTDSSLAIVYKDGAGNAYVFDFPKVKYSQSARGTTGVNTDVIRDMNFSAIRNTTEDITMRIARFAA